MKNRYEELRWLKRVWPTYRKVVQKKLWDFERNYWANMVWHWGINRFSLSELLWASGALMTYGGAR